MGVDNGSGEFSGVIEGSGSGNDGEGNGLVALAKVGSGVETLTGTNAYGGGTTISGGTLQLGDGATDGSLVGDITDNTALVFDNQAAETYSGAISGSGVLYADGTGGLTLSGAVSGSRVLHVDGAGAATLSGVVSGSGGLTKDGAVR